MFFEAKAVLTSLRETIVLRFDETGEILNFELVSLLTDADRVVGFPLLPRLGISLHRRAEDLKVSLIGPRIDSAVISEFLGLVDFLDRVDGLLESTRELISSLGTQLVLKLKSELTEENSNKEDLEEEAQRLEHISDALNCSDFLWKLFTTDLVQQLFKKSVSCLESLRTIEEEEEDQEEISPAIASSGLEPFDLKRFFEDL